MENELHTKIFTCSCGDFRHIFEITWENTDEEDPYAHEMHFSVLTDHELPLWHRIKNSFNHIFKRRNYYIASVYLELDDVKTIHDEFQKFIDFEEK